MPATVARDNAAGLASVRCGRRENPRTVIIAQLSDPHCVPPGQLLYGSIDSNAALEQALATAKSFTPKPSVVLLTGDLAEDGSVASYKRLRQVLEAELDVPTLLILGNHDNRSNFQQVFGDWPHIPGQGFVQYVVDDFPLRLVALDTAVAGEHHGELCAKRLAWLDQTLAQRPEQPTFLLLHHPPVETGVWWMDSDGLFGRDALETLLKRHSQVIHLACGHVHRAASSRFADASLNIAPGTCFQVHLDLLPKTPPRVTQEPPGLSIHRFADGQILTHVMGVQQHAAVDISASLGGWDVIQQRMQDKLDRLRRG